MQLRKIVAASALLLTGTVIGMASQQIASADVSIGNRPVLVPIEPCRLADTRGGVGPQAAPVGPGAVLTLDTQAPEAKCAGSIPVAATALALNVTALNASARTFLTIYPDGNRPGASSLNPAPGQPPTPNAVTTGLSATGQFRIYNDLGQVDVIVDVVGYYDNHDHDDRYDSSAEVDAKIAAAVAAVPADDGIDAFGIVQTSGALLASDGVTSVSRVTTGVYRISLAAGDYNGIDHVVGVDTTCRATIATYAGSGGDMLVFINEGDADTFVDCLFSFTVRRV